MNRLPITLAVALLTAVGAQQLTAQNLLTNPHFDTDTSGWGGFLSAFDGTLDVNGSPTSGSLKWINDNTTPFTSNGGPGQCIGGIVPLAPYHLSVQVFVPSGQAFTGSGFACIAWFSGSCPMVTGFLSEPCTPFAGVVGSWTPAELITTAPAGAASGLFVLSVFKVEAGGSLQTNFDDAVFEGLPASPTITAQASPSVPVGGVISDTATLAAGAIPTGTVTFNLFGPTDPTCSGSPIFTSAKTITGNGNYTSDPFTALAAGIYRWVASYSGDTNNNAAGPTSCADPAQAVVVSTTADLDITVDDGASTATTGGTVTYTIVASNAGPGADPAVTVTDTFPPALSGCSVTSVAAGGAAGNDPGPTAGPLADSGISLPPGSSVTYTATCTLGTSPGPTLANTATVTGSVSDPNATNNSATDTDAVGASLAATKTVSVPPYVVGGTVTYTIVLTNGGGIQPDNPGPELVDALPFGLALSSASASSGTWGGVSNSVSWNGSVPAGGTVTITIQAVILPSAAGQTIANQASIAFDANGDGTNEAAGVTDDPTVAGGPDATLIQVADQPVLEIPTLGPLGFAVLLLALATAGLLVLRRRDGGNPRPGVTISRRDRTVFCEGIPLSSAFQLRDAKRSRDLLQGDSRMSPLKKATLFILAAALALPVFAAAQPAPPVSAVERHVLADGVAEYFFTVRVGSGPYDQIGLHRVVKETAPNVPAHASRAVFLAPGDIWNFRAAFLTGARPIPVFLAQNGLDVWGIDYRWTFVPASVTDLSFMKDWGLEQDARDLGVALGVARFTRAITGSGFGKVFLLGWSRGGQIGYAYLNGETQLPLGLRQVKGFIPVDIYLKTDQADLQAKACQRAQGTEAAIAAGSYAATSGVLINAIGNAAVAAPNGPSAIVPGFNNHQTGLFVGEATFGLLGGLEPVPFYHFTGGTFDANGIPTGLLYSNEADLFHFEIGAAPYQPNQELADADTSTCGQADVGFDDHLSEITVPVLYVGAGGGFGPYGVYTTTLLGSTDVSTHIVSLAPVRIADFGHADLFLANQAPSLVWQPILDWVRAH